MWNCFIDCVCKDLCPPKMMMPILEKCWVTNLMNITPCKPHFVHVLLVMVHLGPNREQEKLNHWSFFSLQMFQCETFKKWSSNWGEGGKKIPEGEIKGKMRTWIGKSKGEINNQSLVHQLNCCTTLSSPFSRSRILEREKRQNENQRELQDLKDATSVYIHRFIRCNTKHFFYCYNYFTEQMK